MQEIDRLELMQRWDAMLMADCLVIQFSIEEWIGDQVA
jgi:hypothetical protein